jgi:hypothetical protein
MHTNRFVLASSAFAAAMLTAWTQASAEPGDPYTAEALAPLPHAIVDAAAELPASYWSEPGFGKVTLDYSTSSVEIFWHGTPPLDVAKLDGSMVDGVLLSIVPTKYSDAQLVAAGEQVFASETKSDGTTDVVATLPNEDLSGLIVEVLRDSKAAATPAQAAERYAAQVGLPVEVHLADGPIVPTTRQNDSAPWQGGGAMADSTGDDYCSTGFAIVLSNGQGRLLSSSHCDISKALGATIRDGVGDRIGDLANRDNSLDSELIDPDASPATIGKVFGGAWNELPSSPAYQHFVGGASAPVEGQDICTSGARSGEHCGRTIRATSVDFDCGHTFPCTGFRASGPPDTVAVARGDSGGPMYVHRSDGTEGARGIITAGEDVTPCGSVAEPTTCFVKVYGIGIHKLLDRWNASIEIE